MTKVLLYIPLLVGLLLFPALGLVDFQARVNACERRDFLANIRALAEQGNALAQNSLGGKYATGQGVSQDYQEAVMWYRQAAEQGLAVAQFNLGNRYAKGKGVSQDYQEAAKWFRRAAEQGDASAQFNLGIAYRQGRGVPKNYVQAYLWATLAEGKGIEEVVELRDSLEKIMTPDQLAEAQRLAREWKPKGK